MTEPQQSLEEALFELATQKPAGERGAFLDGVCRGQPALRARLDLLLEGHFAGAGFLHDPPERESQAPAETMPVPSSESPAPILGRYKLLEKVGEGGFGEVWMAEQREPVKRRVALKILKLGMDSRQVVARFEAERQALAMMDHPNIARILDADVTDTGRPYFVMELVRGIRITEYCDQNQLPNKERLGLFIKVCQAIQHAHQKGIIHRDIKPSNILVTVNDGVPVPKVIDFGIAKATQGELTDKTVFTQFQQFIGTPAYISPEQAEMSSLDIDTRADIYSLGVLLYELLVGQTPFDAKEMMKGGLDALRQIIREQEPQRPSTRLNTLPGDARTTAGKRRQTDAGKLVHQLQGDLDWIVMKCLEKDRTRRYETANGLALDIQRHLANEPIVARPPSAAYRIQKTWQRNKLAFSAAAAVALALVVGLTASLWQAVRATRATGAESRQRVAAQKAEATALAKQQEAEQARVAEATQRRLAEARAYAADMNLAQEALAADNLGQATDLLNRHRPQPGLADRRGWEWRFLWQQSRSDALYTLCKKQGWIKMLSVSHDGKWLAVGAEDRVSVWNLATRQEVLDAEGRWNAMAFSPTEPLLAMWNSSPSGADNWLHRWNPETGRFTDGPPKPTTLEGKGKFGLAFLPDGRSVLASSQTNATLWRLSDRAKLAEYPIGVSGYGIGFPFNLARNTNLFAVAESDLRIRVYEATTGRTVLATNAPGNGWLESSALSPDGRMLATCSGLDETVVRLWDVASGRELATLDGHRSYVSSLVFWPDGKTLASGSADRTIRIWDVGNRRTRTVLRGHQDEVHRLALLPDNSTLVSGGKDGSVLVWGNVTVPPRRAAFLPWKTGPHRVFGAHWSLSRKGDEILTVEADGQVRRWRGPDFQRAEDLFQIDPPRQVRFSPDHQWLATFTRDCVLKVWNVPGGKWQLDLPITNGPASNCLFVADTRLAVWSAHAESLATFDVLAGRQISSWSDPDLQQMSPVISSDGRWCLVWGANNTGHLRELSSGRTRGTMPTAEAIKAVFSDDGQQLAIAYRSGMVRRWRLPSFEESEPMRDFRADALSMVFSANGRHLAAGEVDHAFRLWDLESGHPLLRFAGDKDHSFTREIRFSADGSTVAVLHHLGTIDIWRAPSFAEIAAAEAKEKAENQQP